MWDIGTHDALGEWGSLQLDSYILQVAKEGCLVLEVEIMILVAPPPSFLTPSFVIIEATTTLGLMGCVCGQFWFLLDCKSTQLC
jgi:hypothetical protein